MRLIFSAFALLYLVSGPIPDDGAATFDVIIRHGLIVDGSGGEPFKGDVAIQGDSIAAIGDLTQHSGKREFDATGMAVAPGFINMLSWADRSLLLDGRSMSNVRQGVTLEVFGEGESPGPVKRKGVKADSLWTTLDGYFNWLMKKGVSPNVASFVGATTVRIHAMGYDNRAPTSDEMNRMKSLVREAMEDGAMGLGTSLIYAPATYASTNELIELARVAASYGGMYTTHMRSEGDFILQALNETFTIAREAGIAAEIHHLKINLSRNWPKADTVLSKIDSARAAGLRITANLYPYVASSTGLTARLPAWVQEGGARAMRKKLQTPSVRKRVLYEMGAGIPYRNSPPEDVRLLGFRTDSLSKLYRGKTLAEAARIHGKNADETVIDLIVSDRFPIAAVYYQQTEENIRKFLRQPYTSIGSDGISMSDHPAFDGWETHPRSYGTFARILGKYVREEHLLTLQEAVYKLTFLPAQHLKLRRRGLLKSGYLADVVVFNPETVTDHATFEKPKVYATGVEHVFINGVPVLLAGEHTGARPGRVIRGEGWRGNHAPKLARD